MNNNDNWYPPHGQEEGTKLRTQQRPKPAMLWAIVATVIAVIFGGALLAMLMSNQTASSGGNGPQGDSQTFTQPFTPTGTFSATPTEVVTPTPATAAGTTTCNYDASTGFNSWSNALEWKPINDGTFGSDGTGDGTGSNGYVAWSDCKLSTANYAVEAQIQYARSTDQKGAFEYGIILHGDGNKSGYEVGVGSSKNNCGQEISEKTMITLAKDEQINNDSCGYLILSPLQGASASKDYQLDTQIHTYRAEITGNTIKLSLDGRPLLETTDNTYTDAGQVGLRDIYGDINVKSFKVIAL